MKTVKECFEEKFEKTDGCWEWRASKLSSGYGQFAVDRHPHRAHRVAYQLYVGEIPDGMLVCHHCDNPACVRPDHLFLGTISDNVRDRENKGRGVHPAGEKHSQAKLTENQVKAIREKHSDGVRNIDLAIEYSVSRYTIQNIVYRRRWTKVSDTISGDV